VPVASDRDYFQPDLVDRLKARGRAIVERLQAAIGFHTAYQKALLGEDGKVRAEMLPVLADLRAFCFADASTFAADPRRADANAGRREVWLRIERGLRFDHKKIENLNRQLKELEDDE
jgi:hypothetical protein